MTHIWLIYFLAFHSLCNKTKCLTKCILKKGISPSPDLPLLEWWLLCHHWEISMCENSLKTYEIYSDDFCSCSGLLKAKKKEGEEEEESTCYYSVLLKAVSAICLFCHGLCQESFPLSLQWLVFTEAQQVWFNTDPKERVTGHPLVIDAACKLSEVILVTFAMVYWGWLFKVFFPKLFNSS